MSDETRRGFSECGVKAISIDGVKYVRADLGQLATTGRYVLVLDRGWIVAGDVFEENGRIKVMRAIHVHSWEEIGFDGMIANPKSSKVVLRALSNGFDVPADSELFRVPVSRDWGL